MFNLSASPQTLILRADRSKTKGLSLEDMDILFGSPQATSDVELGIAVDPEKRKNGIDSTHVEMSGASTAD